MGPIVVLGEPKIGMKISSCVNQQVVDNWLVHLAGDGMGFVMEVKVMRWGVRWVQQCQNQVGVGRDFNDPI